MDTRVWVGPAENAPSGWTVASSLEAFLSTSPRLHPSQIVIDDRAGALRESDFQRVYAHCPLARIIRIVGPWRAGIGRTDPAWPLATTLRETPSSLANTSQAPSWLPLTSGYDELAVASEPLDLVGLTVAVSISDPQLREMWIDTLKFAGAELRPHGAEVLIQDEFGALMRREESHSIDLDAQLSVYLCADPWNMNADARLEACAPTGRKARGSSSSIGTLIVASILDAPAAVMQRAFDILKRGPT